MFGLSYVLHPDRYAAAVKKFMQECENIIQTKSSDQTKNLVGGGF